MLKIKNNKQMEKHNYRRNIVLEKIFLCQVDT